MSDAYTLTNALGAAWADHVSTLKGGHSGKRSYVYASGRRVCTRAMALDMMHPEDRDTIDADAAERMTRGDEVEAAKVARLMQIGPRCSPPFRVVQAQTRFEIKDRDGRVLIVGKTDGRLDFGGPQPVFEVKSGQSFQRVNSLEDLDRGRWTRHTLDQLLAYLLATSEPWGVLILDRPALPLFLPVVLEDHLGRAESFLTEARSAIDGAETGILPDFTPLKSECRSCSHMGKSCFPPIGFGEGMQVIDDPHLVDMARQRNENRAAHEAFEEADKALKSELRGVELGLLGGEYAIEGRWQPDTKYNVPKEIKAQYAKVVEQGKFFLTIEPIAKDGGTP